MGRIAPAYQRVEHEQASLLRPRGRVARVQGHSEGRISDLLAALDACIERELDLINISVVSDEFSELLAQKLHEARQKGMRASSQLETPAATCIPGDAAGCHGRRCSRQAQGISADSSHVLRVVAQLIGQ